jgi:hypothetical protein
MYKSNAKLIASLSYQMGAIMQLIRFKKDVVAGDAFRVKMEIGRDSDNPHVAELCRSMEW